MVRHRPLPLEAVKRRALPILASLAGASLVGLLVYGVVARQDDTTLDSAVKLGKRPAAPGLGFVSGRR